MDSVNAVPVNGLFWNLVSAWNKLKTLPLCSHWESESAYFVYWWHHHPTPQPLAFDLLTQQLLITTTMADFILVFMQQNMLSLVGSLGQNIMLLCHYAERKRIMDSHIRHIISDPPRRAFSFYCLFVYSAQALSPSACFVSSSPFLVNFRRHL